MKHARFFTITALGFALCGAASSVSAFSLGGYTGPVEIKFAGFSTDASTFGSPCALGSGCENNFVVGNVSEITDGFNALWSSGTGGEYITFIKYGISDFSDISTGPMSSNHYAKGATAAGTGNAAADGFIHLDFYIDSAPGMNPNTTGPASRTGYSTYTGLTDGTLFLSTILVPGIATDDPSTAGIDESTATLFINRTAQTVPLTGDGSFFAAITGGSQQALFNSNGYLSGAADFFGQFDLTPNSHASCNGPMGASSPACFDSALNDPLRGAAVPIPAAIGFLGIGFSGLLSCAWIRRRRSS